MSNKYTWEQLEAMTEAELDEIVIDLKLKEASSTNNSGPGRQIEYILGSEKRETV